MKRWRQAALALLSMLMAGAAQAQGTYPDHKIRMIVPFAAGGPTDVIARLVADRLSGAFGQQVYVEDLPGAGGNLGVETGKRAAPDGYTIVTVSTGFIINPSMYSKIGYDPVKDFAPISLVAASPNVVVVHPSLPAKNLKELIDLIKANPGKYSYAQPSTGSTPHLAAELMKQNYGLDLTMVPFNGAAPAINSTLGNHTPIAFTALPPTSPQVKAGTLRGLAVTSAKRSPALPDVPTLAEAGLKEQESETMQGIFAPAKTPKDVVDLLHKEIVKVMAMPDVKEKCAQLGFDPVANTPVEFTAYIKKEVDKWGKVIKDANIPQIK